MTVRFRGWRAAALAAAVVHLVVASPCVRADVPAQVTRVGNPGWTPVDFHLFAAPADPFDAFIEVADAVLGPPGQAVPPPYDNLLGNGIAAAGYQSTPVFTRPQIAGQPLGVFFGYTLVPSPGTTGSSLDFASGPIIPNASFPLTDDTDLLRQGVVVDPEFDSEIPPLGGFDGYSHITNLFASHAGYFPVGTELVGNYEYRSVLRDAAGNGWNLVVPFQVVPEPACLGVILVLLPFACGRQFAAKRR